MNFADELAKNRRLIMLRALDDAGFSANETVLKSVTEQFGHRPTRDLIRADLAFLDEHGLARLEKVRAQNGEIWIATLTTPGQEVAQGRTYPGVARREPG